MTRHSSPLLRTATQAKSPLGTCSSRNSKLSVSRIRVTLPILTSLIVISLWFGWAGCGIQDVFSFAGRPPWASASCPSNLSSIIMRLRTLGEMLWALVYATPATALSSALLPSYPLAVKSPYLSTWVPGNQLSNAATAQPQFWTGTELTWPILARVDGTTYALFGAPSGLTNFEAATTDSVSYTALHTYIKVSAGSVNFTLDFFTPVYPKKTDYLVHSLPYSYLTVSANTTGYAASDVQVFSAIDQTWTAQNGRANLNLRSSGDVTYFEFHNPNEIPFTESSDMATWGSVVFGTRTTDSNITFDCNNANSVYSSFASSGSLSNSNRTCSGTYLAGIAADLGTISSGGASATFAVGFDRPQAVNYLGAAQTGYYRTRWPTIPEALSYFLGHYEDACTYASGLDALVRQKTESVSSDFGGQYADICEASFRQAIAPIEITVPLDDLSASPSAFLKEISSNGNMNTVDLIFQSWPIYINLNPEWWMLQLKPTLEYLATGRWPNPWVIHDMGLHYPNATGHDNGDAEQMPLFETSTIFILMLAYQQLTGDTSYTQAYSSLFPGWAEYLIENSLYPASQLISVDAIAGTPNQTALAIQSAIGLNAASVLTGNTTYATIAKGFAETIYNDALGLDGDTLGGSTHFTYNYGNDDSWNVIFAAYSDVVLNLTTFPQAAWDLQSDFYLTQIKEAGLAWAGPPSDKGVDWALTDWNIMTASVMSTELQKEVVQTTWEFMTNGKNSIPFGTKYYVSGSNAGVWIANKARSTVGTHFALAALQQGLWNY